MSNYDQPSGLDAAIDETVREMVQRDPRPGLRRRVTGEIRPRGARYAALRFGFGWAAAVAMLLVAAAVFILKTPQPSQPVDAPQVAVAPPAVPVSPPAGPQADVTPSPAPPAVSAKPREASPEEIFGPRSQRVGAASLPSPAVTARETPADPVRRQVPVLFSMAAILPITVAPIHVAPIVIEPLVIRALETRK